MSRRDGLSHTEMFTIEQAHLSGGCEYASCRTLVRFPQRCSFATSLDFYVAFVQHAYLPSIPSTRCSGLAPGNDRIVMFGIRLAIHVNGGTGQVPLHIRMYPVQHCAILAHIFASVYQHILMSCTLCSTHHPVTEASVGSLLRRCGCTCRMRGLSERNSLTVPRICYLGVLNPLPLADILSPRCPLT